MPTGMKFDKEKLRWDLLDLKAIEGIVKVLTYGAKKYAPHNWKKVKNGEDRYYAALMRHLTVYRDGEKMDESGLTHLEHVGCNIMFLLYFENKGGKNGKKSKD